MELQLQKQKGSAGREVLQTFLLFFDIIILAKCIRCCWEFKHTQIFLYLLKHRAITCNSCQCSDPRHSFGIQAPAPPAHSPMVSFLPQLFLLRGLESGPYYRSRALPGLGCWVLSSAAMAKVHREDASCQLSGVQGSAGSYTLALDSEEKGMWFMWI